MNKKFRREREHREGTPLYAPLPEPVQERDAMKIQLRECENFCASITEKQCERNKTRHYLCQKCPGLGKPVEINL
jgi:hypothetical protein